MERAHIRNIVAAGVVLVLVFGVGGVTRSSAQHESGQDYFQRTISLGVPTVNYDAIEPVDTPKGYVLVVDHVSIRTEAAIGEKWLIEVGVAESAFTHYLVLHPGFRADNHGELREFLTASQPMRFYLQPGESLLVRVTHNGADGMTPYPNAGVIARVSGHFEKSKG